MYHIIVATIRANLDPDPRINYIKYFVLTVPDLFQFDGDCLTGKGQIKLFSVINDN